MLCAPPAVWQHASIPQLFILDIETSVPPCKECGDGDEEKACAEGEVQTLGAEAPLAGTKTHLLRAHPHPGITTPAMELGTTAALAEVAVATWDPSTGCRWFALDT